jgi:hypothetical protein
MIRQLAICLGVVAVALFLPTSALGQVGLELSPKAQSYDGTVIEVPPGDVELLWFHIIADGGWWHVNDYGINFDIDPSGPEPPAYGELVEPLIETSVEYWGCEWYPFGWVKVDGPPCTMIDISVSITVQQPTGTITSNTIRKHIVPEPSTMAMLGAVFCGIGGVLLLRRRR